jgi:pyruvate dehydrogenase E1 component beta subunit
VVLEEAASVASEITYIVQERWLSWCANSTYYNCWHQPYSPVLLKEWLPNADDVIKAVKKVMYK